MRYLIVILITFLISPTVFAQERIDYRIQVTEWSMMINNVYEISNDSIKVNYYLINERNKSYSKKLTDSERDVITDSIHALNVQELGVRYVNHELVDCDLNYDWNIKIGTYQKSIHVYKVEVDNLVHFAQIINKLIPQEMQLGYNAEYILR